MNKQKYLLVALLLTSSRLCAQEISVLACHYKIKIIKVNDTTEIPKEVWIAKKWIYEFNENNPLKYSLYDFEQKNRKINITGNMHELDLNVSRIEYQKEIGNKKFGSFGSNLILSIPQNKEVVYLDSTIKIPYISTGYRDLFDNGTGFLPIYSTRKSIDVDGVAITILISLESKANKRIDQKRIHNE